MQPFVERLIEERKELFIKWEKLVAFLATNHLDLSSEEVTLLKVQQQAMSLYIYALDSRIKFYTKE